MQRRRRSRLINSNRYACVRCRKSAHGVSVILIPLVPKRRIANNIYFSKGTRMGKKKTEEKTFQFSSGKNKNPRRKTVPREKVFSYNSPLMVSIRRGVFTMSGSSGNVSYILFYIFFFFVCLFALYRIPQSGTGSL